MAIFVDFTYNGENLHGQIDFQRQVRKGNNVFFAVAVGTTPVVTIDVITDMNWDYTFTDSYQVIRRGSFYVPANTLHAFNAGGNNDCRGTIYT